MHFAKIYGAQSIQGKVEPLQLLFWVNTVRASEIACWQALLDDTICIHSVLDMKETEGFFYILFLLPLINIIQKGVSLYPLSGSFEH